MVKSTRGVRLQSPHTRGSNLSRCTSPPTPCHSPRTRGGQTTAYNHLRNGGVQSPHTRGSNHQPAGFRSILHTVPAHAGVKPGSAARAPALRHSPRTRGGQTRLSTLSLVLRSQSPHTRGSNLGCGPESRQGVIAPAHAGVKPKSVVGPRRLVHSPRTRGGQTGFTAGRADITIQSPHTRGSNPACAGNHRRG